MVEALPTEELKQRALALGFQSVGVCEAVPAPHHDAYARWIEKGFHGSMRYLHDHLKLKSHPESLLPSVQSIVAVTLNYNQPLAHKPGEARIARYALGRDYHKVLRKKLKALGDWVTLQYPGATCRPCVDSAPIFERDYARLAGLGFFGKNTMLIDPKRGSWFFIGLLLTTARFQPDPPFDGGCGTCTRCIDACPTGALVYDDDRWQLDARRCISYLTIEHSGEIDPALQHGMGEWTFGCDVCQEVCPFNEPRDSQPLRAIHTEELDFLQVRPSRTLTEWLNMPNEQWDEITKGSPIRRTGREGMRRNAEINLRNATSKTGSE